MQNGITDFKYGVDDPSIMVVLSILLTHNVGPKCANLE